MNIAVIGAGVSGLGAAWALSAAHAVTLYEAAPRAGGHVYTVDTRDGPVDLGFIVCNRERYPQLFALFAELGIATRPTTMSVSVALPARGLEWSTAQPFADRALLASPGHWRFLAGVARLVRAMRVDLARGEVRGTLDAYLAARRVAPQLREAFVIPLAAALWSLAPARCGEFPAETFVQFLDQHGMLRLVRPLAWHTVVGGSARYVDALLARLHARPGFALRLAAPVTAVVRDPRGAEVVVAGTRMRHDRVVLAVPADAALRLLAAPTAVETRVLGAFRYSDNQVVLHRDRAFLPRRPAAHAAWNYVADPDTSRVAVTYSMTRLQGLPDAPAGPYLVTLNPRRPPRDPLHHAQFRHPQLDAAARAAQGELAALDGPIAYFAGAHAGFGFHEDGLRSGLAAAARLLAAAPAVGAA